MKSYIRRIQYLFLFICGLSLWGATAQAQNAEANTQEVQFSFAGQTYWGEQVLTTGHHPFNQMAQKVKTELNDLKIISSHDFLNQFSAQAAFVYKMNTIFIGNYIQNENPLNQPTFLHELIHAYIANHLAQGELFPFSGYSTNDDPKLNKLSYGSQFALDEITANLFSLFYNTKVSQQSLKANNAYNVNMGIFDIYEYANRIKRMLTTLQIALSSNAKVTLGDELKAMKYSNIQWQTLSIDQVKVVVPAKMSAQTRENIIQLSKNILPLVDKINVLFPDLQKLDEKNISNLNGKITEYIDLSEQILNIYRTQFPDDANLWKKFIQ